MVRVLKRKWQPRTSAIKDKKGKTLKDKSDIMERWTEYYSELYKNEDDDNTAEELMKELEWISPPQKDDTADYILKEEVEKAIIRMKNKNPAIDKIASEMIKAGRDCLTDHLHHICNLIWKDGGCLRSGQNEN